MLKLSVRSKKITVGWHLSVRLPGIINTVRTLVGCSPRPQEVYLKIQSGTYGGHLKHIFQRA